MPEVVKVTAPNPVTGLNQGDHPALFEAPTVLGNEAVGAGAAAASGKLLWPISFVATDLGPLVFRTPVLLKHKADAMPANVSPPPFQPSSPGPVSKQPRCNCDQEVVNWMWVLLWKGVRCFYTLHLAQMAAQEASGVIAAVML